MRSQLTSYEKEIQTMLQNPPNSWQKLFESMELGISPTIQQILSLLDKTVGGNPSYEGKEISTFTVPNIVKEEAMKGIRLSYKNNYSGYKGIGLARAIQLATQNKIPAEAINRIKAFFNRNVRYEQMKGFGDDTNPSKSYLAYLNWGGIPAKNWVNNL